MGPSFIFLAQASESAASKSVALDLGTQRATGSKGTIRGLDQSGVILVALLAGKHAAVFDARSLFEILNGVTLGR